MNVNLGDDAPLTQDDIGEHLEIMRAAGVEVRHPVMLLQDPEYPGVYRVWSTAQEAKPGQDPSWAWVTPDGEVIQTQRPWAVTA